MKFYLAIFVVTLLTACAVTGPRITEGNERTVVVDWYESSTWSDGTLAVADKHCAQFNRIARYSGKPAAFKVAYDCVER